MNKDKNIKEIVLFSFFLWHKWKRYIEILIIIFVFFCSPLFCHNLVIRHILDGRQSLCLITAERREYRFKYTDTRTFTKLRRRMCTMMRYSAIVLMVWAKMILSMWRTYIAKGCGVYNILFTAEERINLEEEKNPKWGILSLCTR